MSGADVVKTSRTRTRYDFFLNDRNISFGEKKKNKSVINVRASVTMFVRDDRSIGAIDQRKSTSEIKRIIGRDPSLPVRRPEREKERERKSDCGADD